MQAPTQQAGGGVPGKPVRMVGLAASGKSARPSKRKKRRGGR